jgi:predicted RND superfamily exporter protein
MTKKQRYPFFSDNLIRLCEQQIIRFPWTLLILSLYLSIGTSYYIYEYLGVNTNTAEMQSPDLPFQQNQRRLNKAFSHDASTTIFVVESNAPEETTKAADKLVALLDKEKERPAFSGKRV